MAEDEEAGPKLRLIRVYLDGSLRGFDWTFQHVRELDGHRTAPASWAKLTAALDEAGEVIVQTARRGWLPISADFRASLDEAARAAAHRGKRR